MTRCANPDFADAFAPNVERAAEPDLLVRALTTENGGCAVHMVLTATPRKSATQECTTTTRSARPFPLLIDVPREIVALTGCVELEGTVGISSTRSPRRDVRGPFPLRVGAYIGFEIGQWRNRGQMSVPCAAYRANGARARPPALTASSASFRLAAGLGPQHQVMCITRFIEVAPTQSW
jgi:hypothetical protein